MVWEGHPRTTTPAWRKTRRRILERDGNTCQNCGAPGNRVDHVIPVAEGGTDNDSNLRTLCYPCDLAKSSAEGHRARWQGHKRTPETHPGMK